MLMLDIFNDQLWLEVYFKIWAAFYNLLSIFSRNKSGFGICKYV